MSSYFRQQLEEWLKTIDVGGRVIDVGGSQLPVKGRTKSWVVPEYMILDNADRGTKPDIKWNVESSYGVSVSPNKAHISVSTYHGEPFDVVFCLEVMEYVNDPLTTVRNLSKLAKQNGVLYISFPFVYPLHPPHGTDYLRYTKYGVISLLERAGFEVVDYVGRRFKKPELWLSLFASEQWRHDREEDADTLNETGCLITARKK